MERPAEEEKCLTHSTSSDSDTSDITHFVVLVAKRGNQILMQRDKDIIYCCTHEVDVRQSAYERAHLRKEICSYFGISSHTYITSQVSLEDKADAYCFLLTFLELTDDQCDVVPPFEWIDWRAFGDGFDHACPHPHIARFLKSYLSQKDVKEVNLGSRPWRRVGFYSAVLPQIKRLMSNSGYEMLGNPDQVHFGTLSSIFKFPTKNGFVFFKVGFKGNGEPLKTKVITDMFPEDTPRLLGVDNGLEAMISEDHGPSVHELYIVKTGERRELGESELKSLFASALTQWARVQKESIGCIQELYDGGIPLYDKSWIRAVFRELVSYMRETGLETTYKKVLCFEKNMEKTFDAWERFNIPNTLVHGDLDNSNVAQPGGLGTKFIFFDWDSAFVGHPFLELCWDETEEISFGEEAYLNCWKDYGEFDLSNDLFCGRDRCDILLRRCEWCERMYGQIERGRHG